MRCLDRRTTPSVRMTDREWDIVVSYVAQKKKWCGDSKTMTRKPTGGQVWGISRVHKGGRGCGNYQALFRSHISSRKDHAKVKNHRASPSISSLSNILYAHVPSGKRAMSPCSYVYTFGSPPTLPTAIQDKPWWLYFWHVPMYHRPWWLESDLCNIVSGNGKHCCSPKSLYIMDQMFHTSPAWQMACECQSCFVPITLAFPIENDWELDWAINVRANTFHLYCVLNTSDYVIKLLPIIRGSAPPSSQ